MPKGTPTDPSTRDEIISKIRNEGMRVIDASASFGVNSKCIYTWLREGVVDGNCNPV